MNSTKVAQHWKIAIGLIIALALLLRVYLAFVHPTSVTHDRLHHHQFIRALVQGNYERNYEGPYYYAIAAVFTVVSREVHSAFFPDTTRRNVSNGILCTNFLLYCLFLLGIRALALTMKLKPPSAFFLIGFSAALPVIHRSFNMTRPENLMIVLTVWALVFLARISKEASPWRTNKRSLIWLIVLLAFCVTQKITGLVVLVACVGIAFFLLSGSIYQKLLAIGKWALPVVALSCFLWFMQYQLSDSLFYKHRQDCKGHCKPQSTSVFYNFNPYKAWQDPFRDALKDSMLNILFVDLFGDYWRYGIDAWHFYPKSKKGKKAGKIRVVRVRTGIVVSALFVLSLMLSTLWLLYYILKAPGTSRLSVFKGLLPFCLIPLGGHAFLIASTYVADYGLHKFDIIKWEYVLWSMPFLCVPMLALIDFSQSRKLRLLIIVLMSCVICGGYIQSIAVPWSWY